MCYFRRNVKILNNLSKNTVLLALKKQISCSEYRKKDFAIKFVKPEPWFRCYLNIICAMYWSNFIIRELRVFPEIQTRRMSIKSYIGICNLKWENYKTSLLNRLTYVNYVIQSTRKRLKQSILACNFNQITWILEKNQHRYRLLIGKVLIN